MESNIYKIRYALIAEFLGTFVLVFIGCGSIILSEIMEFNKIFIPISFGGSIACMVYIFGKYSGAHFNPCVTIGFLIDKKIKLTDAFLYILIQLFGALIASYIHLLMFGLNNSLGLTIKNTSDLNAYLLEIFFTFLLMTVIFLVTKKQNFYDGIAIGGIVAISAFLIGDLTGGSLNPARSLGPMIVKGNFLSLNLYILGPIIGASLASLIKKFIEQLIKN